MTDVRKAALGLVVGGTAITCASPAFYRGPFVAPTNREFRRILGGSLLTTSLGTILYAVDSAQHPQYKNQYRSALKTTGIIATAFGIGEMGLASLFISRTAAISSVVFFGGGALMMGLADDIANIVKWSE